jgi:hypothetical protein
MRGLAKPLLALAVVASLVSSGLYAQEAQGDTYKLSPQAIQKWSTFLPSETWLPAATELAIPHSEGTGFVCAVDGPKLMVDTNADGRVDMPVKGVSGFLKLVGKTEAGDKFMYPVRFRKVGDGWEWSSSGAMRGRVQGTMLTIIDQNNNGRFNDFGVDAMMVGDDRTAGYLSKVVNLKGDLYNLDVNGGGSEVKVSPYAGETGMIDLRSGFKSYGRLEAAIVVHATDAALAFNLADAKGGMRVPVGNYVLKAGLASKGGESCLIKAGDSAPIEVKTEGVASLEWGAPVVADVGFAQTGKQVNIQPTNVRFFGRAGEEYHTWNPDGASPKFLIKDAESGRLLKEARFGGC